MRTVYYLSNVALKYFLVGKEITPKGVILYFYYGKLPSSCKGTCKLKQQGPLSIEKAEIVLNTIKESKIKQKFVEASVPSGVRCLVKQHAQKEKIISKKSSKPSLYYVIKFVVKPLDENQALWEEANKLSWSQEVIYESGNFFDFTLAATNKTAAKQVFDKLKTLINQYQAKRRAILLIKMLDPISEKMMVLTKYGSMQTAKKSVVNKRNKRYILFKNKTGDGKPIGFFQQYSKMLIKAAKWANDNKKSCFIFKDGKFYGEYLPDKK